MKRHIDKLKAKLKTFRAVANHLEITERHLMAVYAGLRPSKSLAYRIRMEANKP